MDSFTHDGLQFQVIDGGPADGDVVVLLHGFPQDATTWGAVTPLLHEAGMRTLAPHQRGYSATCRPRGVSAYRMSHLVNDVLALLDSAGVLRAHIVGHDWGGAVAWTLAETHPERVASLVVLSTPHPRAMRWALRHGDQGRRSWYMLAFQLPFIPERAMAMMLRRGGLVRSGLPIERHREYAARLGHARDLRGPINWYRAQLRPALRSGSRDGMSDNVTGMVLTPTTYVWGSRDPFLGRDAADRTEHHVLGDYRFVEVSAGHWLPERNPELVAAEIIDRAGYPGST